MDEVVIVSAKRTPVGRFMGGLADRTAVDLAVAAGRAVLEPWTDAHPDAVILGNVLSAGQGMNPARQVALRLGLPLETPAFTVNMMCGSGLQTVRLAAQAIAVGEAEAVLCGGSESMSNAPHLLPRSRAGYRLGDGVLVDGLLHDGLIDPENGEHMAITAERLAERYAIDRTRQDAFAARSQARHAAAEAAGRFEAERVSVGTVTRDEHPRPDSTAEKLATLRPSFRADGTVTAGNASGVNDGAAVLLVASGAWAKRHGARPLARVTSHTAVGCDPRLMGLGPVHALRRLCERAARPIGDFDAIELNEAFAAQSLACLLELGLDDDSSVVNPDGGAIAMGHPIGASGARIATHLAHRIATGEVERGVATLCVGGGMGVALALEAAHS